jgi:hypothetical protein
MKLVGGFVVCAWQSVNPLGKIDAVAGHSP